MDPEAYVSLFFLPIQQYSEEGNNTYSDPLDEVNNRKVDGLGETDQD